MTLKSISYSEYLKTDQEWALSKVDVHQSSMLVVGKNATGKSRFLAIIRSLADSISGKRPPAEGNFDIKLLLKGGEYWYRLSVGPGSSVQSEELTVDAKTVLKRKADSPTELLFEREGRTITTELPTNVLAVQSRQDYAQHPWFVELAKWASMVSYYSFSLGFTQSQSQLAAYEHVLRLASDQPSQKTFGRVSPFEDIISTYVSGYQKYKEVFDKAIIQDMKSLGFQLTDVGVDHVNALMPNIQMNLASIFIQEKGLKSKIPQTNLSQGMFRSLALVISLNSLFFADEGKLILIDDVGEGLDFERASALVKLLIKKSKKHNTQVIMSTNDRYIMNGVPLDQWCILHRVKSKVMAFTSETHKSVFDEFAFAGLSNFDFFSRDFYLNKSK